MSEQLGVPVRGATLPALAAGPVDGDLVLLLHGFPQDASAFSAVLPLLAEAGLRAVAITQRGYAEGTASARTRDLRLDSVAADALAAAEALGSTTPHVVGHDLGALVGWHLAARRPERVRTLTALSTPHPAAYVAALIRSPQALRSAYVPLFSRRRLGPALLGARDGAVLRQGLRRSGLTAERADAYVDRLLAGDLLPSALRWYRALDVRELASTPAVGVPTTYCWSTGDAALDRRGAERTAMHVDAPYRFEVLDRAPHWLPEKRPAEVARLVVDRVASLR